jgi:hypothetical protein
MAHSSEMIESDNEVSVGSVSKSELIDLISSTFKSFIQEVCENPESIGYSKASSSKFTEVYLRDSSGGHSLMTIWKCQTSAEKIAKFLKMTEKRKEWDAHVSELKKICDISEDIAIYYILYKRFLTMAPRDVLLVSQQVKLEGAWVDISTSIHSNIVPENEKVVRAKIKMSGYYIEDIPNDENGNSCRVVHIVDGNYGQSIAGSIAKKMSASIALKFVSQLMEGLSKESVILS